MNGQLIPRNFLNFPALRIPSFIEDIEELLPTSTLLNGLSISSDDKNVYVEAAVPGIDPKEVDITFDKGLLTIRGERKEEEKGKTYQRKATRSFFYSVTPDDVDLKAEPKATYKNGVMTVSFTKMPEIKAKKIAVKTTT